jgi:tRNA-dihydrouridine synthase B
MHMLKIGHVKVGSRLILAPMAGISDLPFRMLNRRFGCELAFVEMLNVRSVSFKSIKTRQMLASGEKDKPLGVQILGSKAEFILQALSVLEQYHYEVLDFNAACPERKVTRRGEGASLLKEPLELRELLKVVVRNSRVPVTVKIRSGWDKLSINAREVALHAQDAGIKALFIHGRTRDQGYSPGVDYAAIRQVKRALAIPVIASGDIFSGELAKKMFDETGCDGLLVARGALGNPWIFRDMEAYLKKGEHLKPPARKEIAAVMKEHLGECVHFYGEKYGVVIFRKFFGWYTKGMRRVRPLREKVCAARTHSQMTALFEEFVRSA